MRQDFGQIQIMVRRSPSEIIEELGSSLVSRKDPRFQRFYDYKPFPVYVDWWKGKATTNVIVGGNKSGKTYQGILKDVMLFTGIVPPSLKDLYPHPIPIHRERHVRIIVQDYTKHWPETIRPLLVSEDYGLLPKEWAQNYDPNEHMFYGPDGSWLSVLAIDPKKQTDPNVLRGPLIDHTHMDELTTRMAYTESLMRCVTLTDGPQTVDLTYCPQEGKGDWTYKDIYEMGYDLRTDEKLPLQERHPNYNIQRVTCYDNPLITPEIIDAMVASLKKHEIGYRIKGLYTTRATDPYYDIELLMRWEKGRHWYSGIPFTVRQDEIDIEAGVFDGDIEQVRGLIDEARDNIWRIWELPIDGEYYLMTIDTAEGREKSDYQCCDVWCCSVDGKVTPDRTRQVAQFHKREILPGEFVTECCVVAGVYGECLMAYEVNNTSGGTVRDRSRNYCNPYKRTMTTREIVADTQLLGWYTDQQSKPNALESSFTMHREWGAANYCGLQSKVTLEEMFSYEEKIERDPDTNIAKRVFGAKLGAFDDTITTFYMMAYIVQIQTELLQPATISRKSVEQKYRSTLEEYANEHESTGKKVLPHLKKQPTLLTLAKSKGQTHGGRQRRQREEKRPN